jgi:hypothetical protein
VGLRPCLGKGRITMKIFAYYVALMIVLILSWNLQELNQAWGYLLGLTGIIICFGLALNELTKEVKK